ncbi:phosphopantetheine-binding protein [Paenibacillus sp. SGZ-1009]|uniref:phosphopantetheine-binding protein n=1 Tax=Paenibacillus campi TaxID=3106031 RepID=UPI002B0025A6|nr:phosphopantetheine-binding protein [Paenibacillus sp. SGZ-1009]
MEIRLQVSDAMLGKLDLLMERIPYLAEAITAVHYIEDDHIIVVDCHEQQEAQAEELRADYAALCDSLAPTRVLGKTVVRSNRSGSEQATAQSVERAATGSVSATYLDETDITLLEQLDRVFIDIARRHGAILREYPSTFTKANMARNQYHINFPQHIVGVATVPHQFKTINRFREQAAAHTHHQSLVPTGEILQPCICYHCYEEQQGSRTGKRHVMTAKGKCFRNEIAWRKDEFRRAEFMMREIVFVGDQQWVMDMRNAIMDDVWELFTSLGLTGHIETATDPFFFSQDVKTKGTYQLVSNAKYELAAVRNNGQQSSIASFNYCEDVLCSKYDICDEDGKELYSGCVAFGMDRWKEALLERYGRDQSQWPIITSVTPQTIQPEADVSIHLSQTGCAEDTEQAVLHVLHNIFQTEVELHPDKPLKEAGLDSITTIDLIVGLETRLGIHIEDQDLTVANLSSIRTITELLNSKYCVVNS